MRKQAGVAFQKACHFTNDQKGPAHLKPCFTAGASKEPTEVNAPVVI